jgi:hypothetical protein
LPSPIGIRSEESLDPVTALRLAWGRKYETHFQVGSNLLKMLRGENSAVV